MRPQYSKISFLHRKFMRTRDFVSLETDDYERAMPELFKVPLSSGIQILLESEMLLLDGAKDTFPHFYVSTPVLQMFLESTPVMNIQDIQEFLLDKSLEIEPSAFGVVHLPDPSLSSIIFYVRHNNDRQGQYIVLVNSGKVGMGFWLENDQTPNGLDDQAVRLVLNLIFYMKAFPDLIRDFVPEDYILPKEDRLFVKRSFTVGTIDGLEDGQGSVAPHYRNGFWRTYRSERYVKKRGAVEWINGFFVKGTNKIVLEKDHEQND